MKHIGDITKAHYLAFVNCITFGSPCQDLSLAGKRAGLAGNRSGLFMEAIRVIKEMREESNGTYPAFAVWENVLGAFSSNKGEDFRTVLEELAHIKEPEISIPRPENGKWAKAGFVCRDEWSLAWRTFDAQFWGVPQRRRRIAVVMDFGGQRAGEILFERESVSGYSEQSIPPWKGIAQNPICGIVGYDQMVGREGKPIAIDHAITTGGNCTAQRPCVYTDGIMATLKGSGVHAVCTPVTQLGLSSQSRTPTIYSPTNCATYPTQIVFESHSQDARYTQQGNTSPACTAQWGTGGNNMPLVAEKQTLMGKAITNTLMSKDYKGAGRFDTWENLIVEKLHLWSVRRLTPTECERLQGYPNGWTDIGEWVDTKGKRHKSSDSARYKALGNSIALPQWWWLVCKMAKYLPTHATLGSLFDGIGGFPLVWEECHGKETAIWASEIEEFPIALTKKRFPDFKTN